jgi:hypothetical protein
MGVWNDARRSDVSRGVDGEGAPRMSSIEESQK